MILCEQHRMASALLKFLLTCGGNAGEKKLERRNKTMVVKVSISELNKASAQDVWSRCQIVIEALTKNAAIFTKPSPDVPALQAGNDLLKAAILNYETNGGGKLLAAAMRARRADVVGLLRLEASYVTATANGDMEILLKGGFPIQKPTRTPVGQLPAPDAPYVKQGTLSGQLDASTTPLYGGQAYLWRVASDKSPEVYVQTAQTTAASASFYDLTPGEIYNIEVQVIGSAGPSDWSDAGSLMVV